MLKNKPSGMKDADVITALTRQGHKVEGLELPSQKKRQQLTPQRTEQLQDISQMKAGVRGAVERGVQASAEAGEARQAGRQGLLGEGYERLGLGLKTVGDVAFETVKGGIKYALSQEQEDAVKTGVAKVLTSAAEVGRNELERLRNSPVKLDNKIAEFVDEATHYYKTDADFKRRMDATFGFIEGLTVATPTSKAGQSFKLVRPVSETFKVGEEVTEDMLKQTLRADAPTPVESVTTDSFVTAAKGAEPEMYQEAVTSVASTYEGSLLKLDSKRRKLEEMARERDITLDELLQDFVDKRGIATRVSDEGNIRFDDVIRDFEARQKNIGRVVDDYLATQTQRTDLVAIQQGARNEIIRSGKTADFERMNKKIDDIVKNAEARYGRTWLTPSEVNALRKEMNTKFSDKDWEVDAWEAVGNSTRNRIDDIVGDSQVRDINAAYGDLEEQLKIARTLDGVKVDAGELTDALGSYIGAIAVGTAGVATGSGSLIIAALAARMGAKSLAQFIRKRKINSKEVQVLMRSIREDEQMVADLLKQMDEAEKAQLERLLLPARGESGAPIEMPSPTRAEGTPTETAREGAVRSPNDTSFNESATTKTTDLTTEARKLEQEAVETYGTTDRLDDYQGSFILRDGRLLDLDDNGHRALGINDFGRETGGLRVRVTPEEVNIDFIQGKKPTTEQINQIENLSRNKRLVYEMVDENDVPIKNFGGENMTIREMKSQLEEIWKQANKTDTNFNGQQDLPTDSRGNQIGLSTQDRGAFGKGVEQVFKNYEDLSAKHLKYLEGKGTVSKQFILDTSNRPELKQPERDLIRAVVDEFDGEKIPVQEYADKMKARLLPLDTIGAERYESVSLSPDLRGNIANYEERIYQSPIVNQAGRIHYADDTNNYFAHTRFEDMADSKTRRLIEIQSDLYQKGRVDRVSGFEIGESVPLKNGEKVVVTSGKLYDNDGGFYLAGERKIRANDIVDGIEEQNLANKTSQLQPYRNTWWERIIREEVKKAALDGKTKLQFPSGETAMKIEGLVNRADKWVTLDNELLDASNIQKGKVVSLQDFEGNVHEWQRFIITENLGDGKFKAVDKLMLDNDPTNYQALQDFDYIDMETGEITLPDTLPDEFIDIIKKDAEALSTLDTVDTSDPIFRFYEKDVQKYLNKNYNAKFVTDDRGVTWIEIDIPKDAKTLPVDAFGVAVAVGAGAYATQQ